MKKYLSGLLIAIFALAIFSQCSNKEEEPKSPDLPPYESMVIDFSKFKVDDSKNATKTAEVLVDTSMKNWNFSKGNVVFWNLIIGSTLIVPVTAFYTSFQNEPVYLGENKWQWSYNVEKFTATYKAELTGELIKDKINWVMNISKEGVGGYPKFKWFEGTSNLDKTGGNWTLYHSYEFQEEVMTIDWENSSDSIGEIKYTYVRELNDRRKEEPGKGSFLTFGLQESNYDAYYNIYFYDIWTHKMVNVDIEWSTTEYYGRVKAPHKFADEVWHCWDNIGSDIECK